MKRDERFPSRYLKAANLPPEGKRVTIDKVVMEEVGQGKDAKDKVVMYMKNASKVLVLNSTNDDQIAKILGTDDDEKWKGMKIVLYPTKTSFGKEIVDCIRVRAVEDDGAAPAAAAQEKPKTSKPSKDESDVADDLDDEIPF